jgi:carbamoyltransferase
VPASHTVFYTLLENFQKLTGLPMLINTSFNLPGAPIVGSLNDAKSTFKGSLADVLVLGDEIYTK